MVRNPGLHSRGHTQGLMHPAKVIVGHEDGHHVLVFGGFLGESVGQPGERAHTLGRGKVLSRSMFNSKSSVQPVFKYTSIGP